MPKVDNQLAKVTVNKIRDLHKELAEKLQFVAEKILTIITRDIIRSLY